MDLELVDPAPVARRVVAAVIDAVPVVALVVVVLVVPTVVSDPMIRWILLGVLALYLVALWAWSVRDGQGPGKALAGLRVVEARTGAVPGAWPALVRSVVRGLVVVGTLGVAGLSYRWDPQGLERTWWDRIAGSRVVLADASAALVGRDSVGRDRAGPPAAAGARRPPAGGDRAVRARWTPDPAPPTPGPVAQPEPVRAGPNSPVVLASAPPAAAPPAPPGAAPLGPRASAPPPVGTPETATVRVPPPAGLPAAGLPAAGGQLPLIRNVPRPVEGGPGPGTAPADDADQDLTVTLRPRTAGLTWDTGRTVVVTGRVLVGREPEPAPGERADRVLPVDTDSRGVSKTHLAIDVTATGVTVTDRHSTNGVRLVRAGGIGARIPAGEPVDLWVGDRVEFGGRSLTVTAISG